MPINTKYSTCLICGADWQEEKDAIDCEAKGNPSFKYTHGEHVVYQGIEAVIDGRGIEEKTHIPWYRLYLVQSPEILVHMVKERELSLKN